MADAKSVAARFKWLNSEGVAGGAFEPDGGYADPVQSVEAYVAAFKRLGGEVRVRHPCRRVMRQGDKIVGIQTDNGDVKAGTVVNAAGPWARALANLADVDLEIVSIREQDTIWEGRAGRELPSHSISNTIDAIYIRPLGDRRYVVGRGYPKVYEGVDEDNYKETYDETFVADVQTRLQRRVPAMEGAKLVHAYTALYDVTPDWYPFVGPRSDVGGYVDFNGGSGHGFKIAPAIAEEAATWLLTGKLQMTSSGFHTTEFRQINPLSNHMAEIAVEEMPRWKQRSLRERLGLLHALRQSMRPCADEQFVAWP